MSLFDDLSRKHLVDDIVDNMCDGEVAAIVEKAESKLTIEITTMQLALVGALCKLELQNLHKCPVESRRFLKADLEFWINEAQKATWDVAQARGYVTGRKPA